MRKQVLAVAVVLSFLAADATAQQLFFLKDGGVYKVKVLKSDWESVTVSLPLEGGGEEIHVVPVEIIEAHCYYNVRNKALEGDAAGRIRLAKYAVDNDMFPRAKAQMDQARALDPKVVEEFMEKEFPKIKEGLAQRILETGQRSLRRGSTENAKKWASLILTKFEGTAAEAGAEELLNEVQAKIDADRAKKRAQRRKVEAQKQEAEAKKIEKERDSFLRPVEKLIDEANAANDRGLRAKSVTQSIGPLESAAKKYESAAKKADELIKKGPPDEATTQSLQEMKAEGIRWGVQAYLNIAHSYSARGSYQKAVTYTNKALALDPDNAEAKAARATISTTSGGWGLGGRRGGRR
ncbi:MAG: tetratricopeptide repeat protein [Planctomycetota bacterium]|jgi:tetratricopeptide (TPR) repeat protein